jgi:hypothetical protein
MRTAKPSPEAIVILFKWNLTQLGFIFSYKKAEG